MNQGDGVRLLPPIAPLNEYTCLPLSLTNGDLNYEPILVALGVCYRRRLSNDMRAQSAHLARDTNSN